MVHLSVGTEKINAMNKLFSVFLSIFLWCTAYPTFAGKPVVFRNQFLYQKAPFPSCHAATIVELKNGDLLAAYFGGAYEGSKDVCIWLSRKNKGEERWEAPVQVADGILSDSIRKPCYNPVLYQMPDGEVFLFFKIGLYVADWSGWLIRSHDQGRTWSEKEPLPTGYLGPIKDKPVLVGHRLICPSSTEVGGWKIHFEIYDLKKKTWKYVGPIEAEEAVPTVEMKKDDPKKLPIECIQPTILKLKDGRLQVLCRTKNGKIATSYSSDQGDSWSKVTLMDLPNNNSGLDAVTLKDGSFALIYNHATTEPGKEMGPRTPLNLAVSKDGSHWTDVLTLESKPGEYSYPSIIQGKDGHLHCIYTWHRTHIRYQEVILK